MNRWTPPGSIAKPTTAALSTQLSVNGPFITPYECGDSFYETEPPTYDLRRLASRPDPAWLERRHGITPPW
jgi:hypothetical protein